jgi:hypothetical protein
MTNRMVCFTLPTMLQSGTIYRFLLVLLLFLCPCRAEAVQSSNPQLVYPSNQRIVIFVADG